MIDKAGPIFLSALVFFVLAGVLGALAHYVLSGLLVMTLAAALAVMAAAAFR